MSKPTANAHRYPADQTLPDDLCSSVIDFLDPAPPSWDTGCLSSPGGFSLDWLSFDGWRWPDWSWPSSWSLSWGRSIPMAVLATLLAAAQAAAVVQPETASPAAQVAVAATASRPVEVRADPGLVPMRGSRKQAVEAVQDAPGAAVVGIVLPAQSAYATLPDESAPCPKPKKRRGREGPNMEIQVDVFNQEQVQGLAEDWLVPRLIDSLIRERLAASKEGL